MNGNHYFNAHLIVTSSIDVKIKIFILSGGVYLPSSEAFPEAPNGRVLLGVQLFKGLEQKGVKSLSSCIKKCAAAGSGVPATVANIATQICFGIDYDFATHRLVYFPVM